MCGEGSLSVCLKVKIKNVWLKNWSLTGHAESALQSTTLHLNAVLSNAGLFKEYLWETLIFFCESFGGLRAIVCPKTYLKNH